MSVLHLYDPDYKLGAFEILNYFRVTRGSDVALHIDRGGTHVDIVYIGKDGIQGDIDSATGSDGCGCP